jgi:hypothetical protein
MSKLINQLARTDLRIRKLTKQIELYRNRVARRLKNPALAEQADKLLAAVYAELAELGRCRKRLIHALEVEAFLSPRAANSPDRHSRIPR